MRIDEDLTSHYPISKLFPIRKIFPWFFLTGIVLSVVFLNFSDLYGRTQLNDLFRYDTPIGFIHLFALTILFVKYLYWELFRRFTVYKIQGEHLIISQGILFKKMQSLAIDRIEDIEVNISPLDYLFGLSSITLTLLSIPHLTIEGLSKETSQLLQSHMSELRDLFIEASA